MSIAAIDEIQTNLLVLRERFVECLEELEANKQKIEELWLEAQGIEFFFRGLGIELLDQEETPKPYKITVFPEPPNKAVAAKKLLTKSRPPVSTHVRYTDAEKVQACRIAKGKPVEVVLPDGRLISRTSITKWLPKYWVADTPIERRPFDAQKVREGTAGEADVTGSFTIK